jgi:hypothetical protein
MDLCVNNFTPAFIDIVTPFYKPTYTACRPLGMFNVIDTGFDFIRYSQ